jgi:hypothetical protein
VFKAGAASTNAKFENDSWVLNGTKAWYEILNCFIAKF